MLAVSVLRSLCLFILGIILFALGIGIEYNFLFEIHFTFHVC